MSPIWSDGLRFRKAFRQAIAATLGLFLAAPAFAQGNSPGRARSTFYNRLSPAPLPAAFPWSQSWYPA
jgi:hypothetical protein